MFIVPHELEVTHSFRRPWRSCWAVDLNAELDSVATTPKGVPDLFGIRDYKHRTPDGVPGLHHFKI